MCYLKFVLFFCSILILFSTSRAANDSNQDEITNSTDIDEDNDGILDANESQRENPTTVVFSSGDLYLLATN